MSQSSKQQVLIIGSSGGIGSNLFRLMLESEEYELTGWSSTDLDLDHPDRIFSCDFSKFDLLINCAGHNQGTYLGFLKNSWQNQYSQIMVNYVSNLFLFKHYANSREHGQYVWLNSILADHAKPYHSVYAGSKSASKFSLDLAAKEAPHINVLDAKIGLAKTNLRYRNFEGTKTPEEIESTYTDNNVLSADSVAIKIFDAIKQNKTEILIV
jgi:short-subunit dehydrogenase